MPDADLRFDFDLDEFCMGLRRYLAMRIADLPPDAQARCIAVGQIVEATTRASVMRAFLDFLTAAPPELLELIDDKLERKA